MANTILTPEEDQPIITPEQPSVDYLQKENYLSEFSTEDEKAIVRSNLGVQSKDAVYTKEESDSLLDQAINKTLNQHLNTSDPHKILPQVIKMIDGVIKNDGSVPFTNPQEGVDPVQDFHLATKRFVENVLKEHLGKTDPHRIIPEIENMLQQYVKYSQVYLKDQLYTQDEINKQNKAYVKLDGSTPFTSTQSGKDPVLNDHLSTKRYVDQTMQKHLATVDPHGFTSILNNKLAFYAKTANVYNRDQTYSKQQIDLIIHQLVSDAAEEVIADHLSAIDPHHILDIVKKEYIKQDGTTVFKNPQSGVDAVKPQDLVTLHQVEEKVQEVNKTINKLQPIWKTSGPVQSTVGFLEDNTPVPDSMTLQQVCDAIFYGSGISLTVPGSVIAGETCPVTICVSGSTGLIKIAELYQGDKVIYTFNGNDFKDGCITVDSEPILEDTTFTFKVTYTNGSNHSESKTVTCNVPIFVGLLPKWKFGYTVSMEYLKELQRQDIDGTQNRFLNYGKDLTSVTFKYVFTDKDLRHPFIVVPETYPKLDSVQIAAQGFGIEAFNVIDKIPLKVSALNKDVIYTMYIYKQALSNLNQEVTYNFKSK